jgi:hypothetical protein
LDDADYWTPEIQLFGDKDTYKATLVADTGASPELVSLLQKEKSDYDAP